MVKASAALLLATIAALATLASASAATPAAYRARVNAVCAGYTPSAKGLAAQLASAQSSGDAQAFGLALGRLLVLQLAEDARIEAVPVPPALRGQMAPILARMKILDAHARSTITAARSGDGTTMVAQLKQIERLSKPMNRWLDGAGLRECGSKQS
jgi:hypothetical protein